MSEALKLDLNIGGFQGLVHLEKLADTLERAADAQDRLNGGGGSKGAQVIDISDKFQKSANAASKAVDPWERLARARERYNEAVKTGNAAEIRATEYQMIRAQQAATRAQSTIDRARDPKAAAMKDLLYSSRINLGVASPLLGKLRGAGLVGDSFMDDILGKITGGLNSGGGMAKPPIVAPPIVAPPMASGGGIGGGGGIGRLSGGFGMFITRAIGAINPLTIAATLGVAAIGLLASAAKNAAKHLQMIAAARFASGGTPEDFARLSSMGSLFGKTPEQMAQEAAQWYNTQGNPQKAAAFGQAGINPVTGPYGAQNAAAARIKAIDYAASLSDDQARRFAQKAELDMSEVGIWKKLNPWMRDRVKDSITPTSPQAERNGVQFNAEMAIGLNMFNDAMQKLSEVVLPPLNNLLGMFIFQVQMVRNAFISIFDVLKKALGWIVDNDLVQIIFGAPGQYTGNSKDDPARATNENTKAIRDLTDTLNNGFYGSGRDRAMRAMPAGLEQWYLFDKSVTGQRMAMPPSLGGISL